MGIKSHNAENYVVTNISASFYNPATTSQELNFTFMLPDKAMVSGLSMITDSKEYFAELQSIANATKAYEEHKSKNKTVMILKVNYTSDQEVLVQASSKPYALTTFTLTYEELLMSSGSEYRQIIKLDPQQLDPFKFKGKITGKFDLERYGNKKIQSAKVLDGLCSPGTKCIMAIDSQPCRLVSSTNSNGRVHKELEVVYSLDQPEEPNTVFSDSYFIHSFTPEVLVKLRRNVIFVIDVSGSMSWNSRMRYTKEAMTTMLDSLGDNDHYKIITFSTGVQQWPSEDELFYNRTSRSFTDEVLKNLTANGETNIDGGLQAGMKAAKNFRKTAHYTPDTIQFIFFMTDGYANVGEVTPVGIVKNLKNYNLNIPVHGLAFGSIADYSLVQEISRKTGGKAMQ